MPSWALTLLAVLLVGGGVLVFGFGGTPSELQQVKALLTTEEPSEAIDATNPVIAPGSLVNDPIGRAAQEGRVAAEGTDDFTHEVELGWIGVVVDESGTPIPGVAVGWVLPWNTIEQDLPITDALGRFALPMKLKARWPSEPRSGLVICDPAWLPSVHQCPPPSSPLAEVRIVAKPADTWLPVRVVETDGKTPRAHLAIALFGGGCFSFSRTDAEGRARLVTKHSTSLEVETFGAVFGWLSAPNPLVLRPGENPELLIQFEGTPTALELIAHDYETNQRLRQAQWFSFASEGVMDETPIDTPDGALSWRLDDHGAVSGYCGVRVSAEGYLPTYFEWTSMPPDGLLSIPVVPAEEKSIDLILTRAGEPIVDEEVIVGLNMPFFADVDLDESPRGTIDLDAFSGTKVTATGRTDTRGLARISVPWIRGKELPDRVHMAFANQDLCFSSEKLGEQPWHFDLAPASASLVFRVVDLNGNAVAGAPLAVWIEGDENSPLLYATRIAPYATGRASRSYWSSADLVGKTGSDGRCRFKIPANTPIDWTSTPRDPRKVIHHAPGIPAGAEHEVLITSNGKAAIAGTLVRAGGEEWDGRAVSIQLLHLDGSQPTDTINNRPLTWASTSTRRGTGRFRFENVPPGSYRLHFHYIALKKAEIFAEAGQEDLVVEMQAMCRLSLQVADANTGELIPGETNAQVQGELRGFAWADLWNGEGTVEFVPGADLSVSINREGYRAVLLPIGDVLVPGSELSRRVELQRGRTVRLQVSPAEAVEDGRFAGLVIRNLAGNEIADYPLSYRTRPGEVDVLNAPREAFQIWLLDRETREPILKTIVAAAEGEPPAAITGEERTTLRVRWPEAQTAGEQASGGG
jgi:hypothetical protein